MSPSRFNQTGPKIGLSVRLAETQIQQLVQAGNRGRTCAGAHQGRFFDFTAGLTLSIAADYGGRWDILQAANQLIAEGATEIQLNSRCASRECKHNRKNKKVRLKFKVFYHLSLSNCL